MILELFGDGDPHPLSRPWPLAYSWDHLRFIPQPGVWVGRWDVPADIDGIWGLHPKDFPTITMYGREVALPRWQQAYGRDYAFSGRVNVAQPVPDILEPYLTLAQGLDAQVNGILANWYDPALGHYIGAHRDSEVGLVDGSSIITLSLGGCRTFRLRRSGVVTDIRVGHGDVLVIPWSTNRTTTHEVPSYAKDEGRRISLTFRSFEVSHGH